MPESASPNPAATNHDWKNNAHADEHRRQVDAMLKIEQLCRQSAFLDAYEIGKTVLGPELASWPTIQGKLVATRLASHLGGFQLSNVISYGLYRKNPEHAEVIYLRTIQRIGSCPLARLWLDINDADLPTDDTLLQARWIGLKGRILTAMRDFDRAFDRFDEAIQLAPDEPVPYLNYADAFAECDEIESALETCRSALLIAPRHTATVELTAHYLLQTNRPDEAQQLMEEMVADSQSGSCRLKLAGIHANRGQYEQARECLNQIQQYFPLADPLRGTKPKRGSVWAQVSALQSEIAFHTGEFKQSYKLARLAGSKRYSELSDSLKSTKGKGKRVQLKVPFKLQKHVTCAPATLTMLSSYWNVQVDHDQIVDQICYNGTAPVDQRIWAVENGMVAKEFRVTFEATQALIDAGIPFGLSTMAPGMGHIQVVCGYDSRRQSVLIQDPGIWHVNEHPTTEILDKYRAFGPRGLVLLPESKTGLLSDIELPDATAFDRQHFIALALESHDREQAQGILTDVQQLAPDDSMTDWAELELARYDSNIPVQLAVIDRLRTRYPDDDVLWWIETGMMELLERPDDVILRLRQAIADGRVLGVSRLSLMELLQDDADQSEREELLRCVLRDTPMSPGGLAAEARRLWNNHNRDQALELFRLAAMAAELEEGPSREYLRAAKRLDRHAEVLEILRRRFERHGDSSHRPGMTYAIALDMSMRTDEAIAVIREALQRRPNDAELICQAAEYLGRLETPKSGLKLLESATVPLPTQDLLRAKATLAGFDGRPEDSLKAYQEIAEQQPLNPGLSETIAKLLVELHGHHDAIKYLETLTQRFPHCRHLLATTAQFLRAAARYTDAIGYIDRMLVAYYADGWCWRERSVLDARCSWYDQSLEDAEQAVLCDRTAASLAVRGDAFVRVHRENAARDDFRDAILLDCDYGPAITSWMLICDDEIERREVLAEIYQQLVAQRSDGEGLATYYDFAGSILEPGELTRQLSTVCEMRPDSYTAWMLLASHYTNFRLNEDAERLLLDNEQRLGSNPGYWAQLGQLFVIEDQDGKAIAAYERGLELHPNDADLSRALAARYRDAKRNEDARKVLTRALQGSPSDPGLMVALAESIEDKKEAMQLARKAALRAPGSSAAWSYLLEICQKNGEEPKSVEAARELVKLRPHDVNAHLRLAEMLHREDQWEESLTVIADAMAIDRRQADAHYLFALRLFERKYCEKALAACSPPEVDPSDLHSLNVFSARIMHATGDRELACRVLRDALRRDPTDLDSWIRLANWAEDTNNFKLYDEAATALIHRGAHLAVAHGYYATTLVRQNRRERAVEHLQYALDLDHKYEFALREMLVLMINQHKTTEAEAFLDKIAEQIPVRMLAMGRLMIAAATDDLQDFLITLECIPDEEEQEEIAAIACEYMSADRFANFGIALNKAIKKRKANKAIGYAWAHFYAGGEHFEFGISQFLKLRRSNASTTAATYFLNILRVAGSEGDEETMAYVRNKTQAILRRLGRYVYRDAPLWSVVLWTLINQDQNNKAVAFAKGFAKVKDRDVKQTVPAILAALYSKDLRLTAKLLADAEAMDPEKMTEECRMLRAMYTVFEGTNAELENASRMVNKNDLDGAFLRGSKLITAGLKSIEDQDPAALIKIWKIEFFRKNNDGDPLDLRIYQLLRSRISDACGDKREAKKWYKGKVKE